MTLNKWKQLVLRASECYETPFFLFSPRPIKNQLNIILNKCGRNVSNWLSLKTLPLRMLLRWWLSTGLGVEVVSAYELLAALEEGFPPEKIMVNGVAKHYWDSDIWVNNLRINIDSINELKHFITTAKKKKWRIGLRYHPTVQNDPEDLEYPDQFGLQKEEFIKAINILHENHLELDTIHIHLRSNITNIELFINALNELRLLLSKINIAFNCLDLGGGLPAEGEKQLEETWESKLKVEDIGRIISMCDEMFPCVNEIILENGRYLLSNCGVLVITVNDIKEMDKIRHLICDGGRTNHALPSDWQSHRIEILPNRYGKEIHTAVCGPTCMAFDCMTKRNLPDDICVGDKIIWFNAGAYHLSWETRFSQPLARVLWHDENNNQIVEARRKETFYEWWRRWR